jgi:hypothetical protein
LRSFHSLLITLLVLAGLTGCSVNKDIFKQESISSVSPTPMSIEIDSNLYYDQSEISNLNWREYMYWTKSVFGSHSEEYHATLPDTSVWTPIDTCNGSYAESYLRQPAYQNYPVVGISFEQALAYSNWRTDRVLEYLLINYNYMELMAHQDPDNYFTIERFRNGSIELKKPIANITHYPVFRLPTEDEWKQAVTFNNSVSSQEDRKTQKAMEQCFENTPEIISRVNRCIDDTLMGDYTAVVHPTENRQKLKTGSSITSGNDLLEINIPIIFRLRGNVREMTATKGISVGGGWCDSMDLIQAQATFTESGSTSNCLGFRNICEWQKIETLTP